MEVEQRINLSLDDIIKRNNKTSAPKATAAGKPKVRAGGVGKTGAGKPKNGLKARGKPIGTAKSLGVRKGKGVVVKKGGRTVKVQTAKGVGTKKGTQQRTVVTVPSRGRPANGKLAGRRRVVADVPAVRTVTVTITNEKALQQQRQMRRVPQPVYGHQQRQWGGPAQPQAQLQPPQPASGYGPRNLAPRGEVSASTSSRFTLSRMRRGGRSGLSQEAGRAAVAPQRKPIPFVDYDNTRTHMRMDYGG